MSERDVMEYDVLTVGAGPAGLAFALRLKQKNPALSVCVIEKASSVGAHALSGAVIETEALPAILSIEEAIAADAKVLPDYDFGRGDAQAAIDAAPSKLDAILRIGGQEHFYLEGQAALALAGEEGQAGIHHGAAHAEDRQAGADGPHQDPTG